MASLGAKVMQPVSIQDARLNRINIEVKSSFVNKSGTLITKRSNIINNKIVTGISSTQNDSKISLIGVRDKPGVAASIFKPLSKNLINVDMVVQNISANGKETDLTFTIKTDDLNKTKKIIQSNKNIKFRKLLLKKNVSKISVIGVGMITTPGVTFKMFQTLANKKIKVISYEEMLEMASLGAKVMQPVSIQDARLNRIDIEVKSSFIKKSGTLITKRSNIINNKIITGISSTQNDSKVSLIGVKDRPGVAASIFKPLSKNLINVDMVVQNISANGKETDLTFTIKSEDLNKTKKIIQENKDINFRKLLFEKNVSKVSVIGVGMITTPGVTFRMFQTLANKKINIQVISTSEIKISVLIDKRNTKKALIALHKEFKLDNKRWA